MIPQALTVLAILLFVVQCIEEDAHCMYNRNIVARSCHHFCRGQAIGVTYSEYVYVPLIIQYAMRMRRVKSSSVGSLTVPYFHIISQTARFKKKIRDFEHKLSVVISSTFV